MFNPFLQFRVMDIETLVKFGQVFLVTQTFNRNPQDDQVVKKKQIIVTEYNDLGLADQHIRALKNDNLGFIIHLKKPKQLAQLIEKINNTAEYEFWWARVKLRSEVDARVDRLYRNNIRRWVLKHKKWNIGGNSRLTPRLEVIFGELVVLLRYGNETANVNLTEIEAS